MKRALIGAAAWWLAAGCVATAEPMAASPAKNPDLSSASGPAAAVEYDFGDFTSQTLTTKAWNALGSGDYAAVNAYTGKCIELYEAKAKDQQAALTDFAPKESAFDQWALNDVATCYFIRGKAAVTQGKTAEAKAAFEQVINALGYAQCWDPKGWFWKVAEGAKDQLSVLGTNYDFGDYTSETLTVKAWKALDAKDYQGIMIYTKKCMDLYEKDAKEQQASLTDYAPKEKAFNYWALNDVGTCYFIRGEALTAQGRKDEAKASFEHIINELSFAQCWDPKGWFWKPAVGARGRINKIIAESGG